MSDSEKPKFTIKTVGFDARFPNTNQSKHCWQNYVDYQKCISVKGEDYAPCLQFFRAYQSLCPSDWTSKWDEQLEEGTNPSDFST
ncbi:MAG: putative COX12-cytochrome-c oxidase, subunit VIB [Piptocephalis tieghemiana]|nr:MAG: putative COX12-cytochrome-c oxidase, subunit VIB [Piptocephalis tieghemiana]